MLLGMLFENGGGVASMFHEQRSAQTFITLQHDWVVLFLFIVDKDNVVTFIS